MKTETTNDMSDVQQGDVVQYRGHEYRVASVKVGMIAGPHVRLTPLGDSPGVEGGELISVQLLSSGAMRSSELLSRRRQLGLSQAELARRLSVDVMTVSRWERAVRAIPPHLRLAMQHLELDIEEEHRASS